MKAFSLELKIYRCSTGIKERCTLRVDVSAHSCVKYRGVGSFSHLWRYIVVSLAGRIPLGTLKLKSDDVMEETESEVATGTRKLRSLPGTLNLDWGKTNANLLFVAGATGGVGSRLVRSGSSYMLFC
jgi:hypothetical protein